ncbi:MAG: hypothetical protein ACQES4_04080 [Bacillota bacterium]
MSENENKLVINRKQFIKNTGIALAGVTLLGGMSSLFVGCDEVPSTAAQPDPMAWPVAFPKMDPDQAAQIAYDSYKSGHG